MDKSCYSHFNFLFNRVKAQGTDKNLNLQSDQRQLRKILGSMVPVSINFFRLRIQGQALAKQTVHENKKVLHI